MLDCLVQGTGMGASEDCCPELFSGDVAEVFVVQGLFGCYSFCWVVG